MSEPESKPPKLEAGGATLPLGSPAEPEAATSTAVAAPEATPERGKDHDTQDPFKFGWHHMDTNLLAELAAKPLPRLDEKDKVKTVPPELDESGRIVAPAALLRRATLEAPVVAPPTAATPGKAPSHRRRGALAAGFVAVAALVVAAVWLRGAPADVEVKDASPEASVGERSEPNGAQRAEEATNAAPKERPGPSEEPPANEPTPTAQPTQKPADVVPPPAAKVEKHAGGKVPKAGEPTRRPPASPSSTQSTAGSPRTPAPHTDLFPPLE